VALVPTMGALHEGHLALVREGQRRCRRVVASIFVNPAQFAPTEDLARYPRTFEEDCALLAAERADLVWAPPVDVVYPQNFATRVVPAGAADGLESASRPHFFAGVATVCLKLFNQVTPDIALFGEKDYQQLQVIRQLVRDLDLALAIVAHPTVREPDGLAMSSRNRYLLAEERQRAARLYAVLNAVAAGCRGGRPQGEVLATGRQDLAEAGFRLDYLEVRDAETLAVPGPASKALRVLVAAWLGTTRLIDNVAA
jgi:pantoate--beta-alanine ligase